MKRWLNDITLKGNLVTLIPLQKEHKEAMLTASADGKLWELWHTSVPSEQTIDAYINTALEQKENDLGLPFVVIHNDTEEIIGCTRFCSAVKEHRRVEIGYTWYAKSHQRTGVNTECKYLLLRHAFEHLQCIAVEFKTNWHNRRSRAAIARLGAHQEGVIRNHRINPDGSYRDSVLFSIIEQDWPNVKKTLEYRLRNK